MYKKFGLMLIISNYWKFLIFQKYIFDILKYANYHVYNKLNCNKIYNNVFYNFYCLLAKVYFIITKVHKVHKHTLLITYVYMGRNNIVYVIHSYTQLPLAWVLNMLLDSPPGGSTSVLPIRVFHFHDYVQKLQIPVETKQPFWSFCEAFCIV